MGEQRRDRVADLLERLTFGAYGGLNSGIPIPRLTTEEVQEQTRARFGLSGTKANERSRKHWLSPATAETVVEFAVEVARAHADEMNAIAATSVDS